jgi:hypothetical protein
MDIIPFVLIFFGLGLVVYVFKTDPKLQYLVTVKLKFRKLPFVDPKKVYVYSEKKMVADKLGVSEADLSDSVTVADIVAAVLLKNHKIVQCRDKYSIEEIQDAFIQSVENIVEEILSATADELTSIVSSKISGFEQLYAYLPSEELVKVIYEQIEDELEKIEGYRYLSNEDRSRLHRMVVERLLGRSGGSVSSLTKEEILLLYKQALEGIMARKLQQAGMEASSKASTSQSSQSTSQSLSIFTDMPVVIPESVVEELSKATSLSKEAVSFLLESDIDRETILALKFTVTESNFIDLILKKLSKEDQVNFSGILRRLNFGFELVRQYFFRSVLDKSVLIKDTIRYVKKWVFDDKFSGMSLMDIIYRLSNDYVWNMAVNTRLVDLLNIEEVRREKAILSSIIYVLKRDVVDDVVKNFIKSAYIESFQCDSSMRPSFDDERVSFYLMKVFRATVSYEEKQFSPRGIQRICVKADDGCYFDRNYVVWKLGYLLLCYPEVSKYLDVGEDRIGSLVKIKEEDKTGDLVEKDFVGVKCFVDVSSL